MSDDLDLPCVSLNIVRKQNQRNIGVAVHKRVHREISETFEDSDAFKIQLYEFVDNDQLSNIDSLLNQIGKATLYVSEEFQDTQKGDGRKLNNMFNAKSLEPVTLKRSYFTKKPETLPLLVKLVGKTSHAVNIVDSERPIALGCLESLFQALRLRDETDQFGRCEFSLESLNTYMKLDSAAADAVNLLPKPDHPSVFGSLFGILNRCKTKMGPRLLERWLRQPLLDIREINHRLNVVESFKNDTMVRNQLRDGPLRGIPDLDTVLAKMHKHNAGLNELYRLYLFVRTIPTIGNFLQEYRETLKASTTEVEEGSDSATTAAAVAQVLTDKFLTPFSIISQKFSNLERLVEHVVDMSQLPDLRINPKHDQELQEIVAEQQQLEEAATSILNEARRSWGSFTDIKMESNHPQQGFLLRTTRPDDERQLRANNSSVQITSILKTGLYFTTTKLQSIGTRYLDTQTEYRTKQSELVSKAMTTALTYLPVVESVSVVIAELDVLLSFATAAAMSPGEYVKPTMLSQGAGIIDLKSARHPCVELMDDMQFIPNHYDLHRDKSGFQLITGPNMGGKSTYIRGVGSIVVMAQIGMLVPCSSATLGVVDCILARVGAGDAVQKGVSTFMAEMLESSVILESATRDSLLIIDELGRGTSTFDGYGLAYAISAHIVTHIQCLCLFATHFHELTALARLHTGVVNKHVSAHVDGNQVLMLYELLDGPCLQSFGIHVAKTADFPVKVIEEAKRKAHQLERVGDSHTTTDSDVTVDVDSHKQKTARMQRALDSFAQLNVPELSPQDIQSSLISLFPVTAL